MTSSYNTKSKLVTHELQHDLNQWSMGTSRGKDVKCDTEPGNKCK